MPWMDSGSLGFRDFFMLGLHVAKVALARMAGPRKDAAEVVRECLKVTKEPEALGVTKQGHRGAEGLNDTGTKVRRCGGESSEGSQKPRPEGTERSRGTKRKRLESKKGPPEDEDPPEDSIWHDGHWMNFDEYKEFRTFVFMHHYSGKVDMLRNMVLKEAEKWGVKVVAISRDQENGFDLLKDYPYDNDLIEARRGGIDAYHSGFPCTTYTKLKWNTKEGYPGPVRSKDHPYGLPGLSEKQKKEADEGTIMLARSTVMAEAVLNFDGDGLLPSIVTLENPPPSEVEGHISAWEMPELQQLVSKHQLKVINFNTCRYERLKLGTRHFKPQRFAGNLPGLEKLEKFCECGKHKHEAIVGKEKSAASAGYPADLAADYVKLLVGHFSKVLKMEFTEARLELASRNLQKMRKLKAESMYQFKEATKEKEDSSVREASRAPLRRRRPESKATAESGAGSGEEQKDERAPLTRKAKPQPGRKTIEERLKEGESIPRAQEEEEEKALKVAASKAKANPTTEFEEQNNPLTWQGGEGKYGMAKQPKSRKHLDSLKVSLTVGGMRDPHSAIGKLPNVLNLGLKVQAAWDRFVRSWRRAVETAEAYGTKECALDKEVVAAWKVELRRIFGAKGAAAVKLKTPNEYKTPVDVELFEAWQKRSGDPDVHVPTWLREGTPLGIELDIPTCGIFPPCDDDAQDVQQCKEFSQVEFQQEWRNYKSVEEHKDQASLELERYKQAGYTSVHHTNMLKELKGYTVSRLGLILKERPDGSTKRRIILDLRRSGGNLKSRLPEKLVLPRLSDLISMARSMHQCKHVEEPRNFAKVGQEFALVDVQDAFTTLAVHERELPHTFAPGLEPDELIMFRALLFGYKTAPLLYSRFAAFVSRMLQSMVPDHIARHQTYLDDAIWMLQGPLDERNRALALVLYTMAALDIPIALGKGARQATVTWVGIDLSIEKDTLVISLPLKFMQELREMLNHWTGKGMAPIKDLRKVAGKAAWMSNALPRFRWVTAVFYAVLKDVLKDVASGKEETRRLARTDQRDKSNLFAVKRLEAASVWAVHFLDAAKERPIRRISLGDKKGQDVRLITDASPEGLGAILLINNQTVGALATPVDKHDASALGFELGSSASQGILEALAVLVGLKHWKNRLAMSSVHLVVQSDSVTALALSQKLSASSAALNFIAAEMSLLLEELAIEKVTPVHIPGVANKAADFLSRPSQWDKVRLPKELEGVEIATPAGRNEFFYKLPSPAAAPDLWGVAAEGSALWEAVH